MFIFKCGWQSSNTYYASVLFAVGGHSVDSSFLLLLQRSQRIGLFPQTPPPQKKRKRHHHSDWPQGGQLTTYGGQQVCSLLWQNRAVWSCRNDVVLWPWEGSQSQLNWFRSSSTCVLYEQSKANVAFTAFKKQLLCWYVKKIGGSKLIDLSYPHGTMHRRPAHNPRSELGSLSCLTSIRRTTEVWKYGFCSAGCVNWIKIHSSTLNKTKEPRNTNSSPLRAKRKKRLLITLGHWHAVSHCGLQRAISGYHLITDWNWRAPG